MSNGTQGLCVLPPSEQYILRSPPPPSSGYGTEQGQNACVNIGVSKGSGQYVSSGDSLTLTAWSSLAGLTVTLAGQQVAANCQVTPFTLVVHPDGLVTPTSVSLNLIEGMITSLSVSVTGSTLPQRGQTYVRASVGIFSGGTTIPYATLVSDYVTGSFQPSFPPAALLGPQEGTGYMRILIPDDVAAGHGVEITQDAVFVWDINFVQFFLETDAVVANRGVSLVFTDTVGNSTWEGTRFVPQPASKGYTYNFQQNPGNDSAFSDSYLAQLPLGYRLTGPGSIFIDYNSSPHSNGDQLSSVRMVMREWLNI